MNAPLSSPSASQPTQSSQYLSSGAAAQSASASASSQPAPTSNPSNQQAPAAPAGPAQQERSTSDADAAPFLRDFTLVSEAAKRAQMAVLMRDMQDVGL